MVKVVERITVLGGRASLGYFNFAYDFKTIARKMYYATKCIPLYMKLNMRVFVVDPVDSALTVQVSVVITIVHQPRWSATGERGYGDNKSAGVSHDAGAPSSDDRGDLRRRVPHQRKKACKHSDDAPLVL